MVVYAAPPAGDGPGAATRTVASIMLIVTMLVAMAIAVAAILFLYNAIEGRDGYKAQLNYEREVSRRVEGLVKYKNDLSAQNREMARTRRDQGPIPTRPPILSRLREDRAVNDRLRDTYAPRRPETRRN
jgi:biopolymer transport protein ExbB/TolQ